MLADFFKLFSKSKKPSQQTVDERWKYLTSEDECGWIPLRPAKPLKVSARPKIGFKNGKLITGQRSIYDDWEVQNGN